MAFALLLFAGFGAFAEDGSFDRKREFPNFFIPAEMRHLPADEIPQKTIDASRRKVEAALQSIFSRLTVPIINEEGNPEQVKYFSYLKARVDPQVKIMPSGGLVRSAFSFLYSEMYKASRSVPPRDPQDVLDAIIRGQDPIPAYQIRGIGSDFDVLIDGPQELWQKTKEIVKKVTNSAINRYGGESLRGAAVKSLFTIGDVKIYKEQTDLSTSQGGATIDFLAHDVDTGKVVEPKEHDYILDDLIRGRYRYIEPSSNQKARDPDKQTIRGIRSLVELPFLEIEDEHRLREELNGLLKSTDSLSEKAVEQIQRTIRNARFSGGNNRLYRGADDSLEKLIEQVLIKKGQGKHGFPEFVDYHPIDARTGDHAELNGIPASALMPLSEFLEKHTNAGVVHHGTPSLDNGFAIQRGGMFISGGKRGQGMSMFDSGGYTSPDRSFAQGYAGSNGMVLDLAIRQDPRLNIIDLAKVPLALREKAKREGKDLHQMLAREHGIDIILNHHVLIQNMAALQTSNNPAVIMRGLHSVLFNDLASVETRWQAYEQYSRMYPYALTMEVESFPAPPTATEMIRTLEPALRKELKVDPEKADAFLADHWEQLDPAFRVEVSTKLLQAGRTRALWEHLPTDDVFLAELVKQVGVPSKVETAVPLLARYSDIPAPHQPALKKSLERMALGATLDRAVRAGDQLRTEMLGQLLHHYRSTGASDDERFEMWRRFYQSKKSVKRDMIHQLFEQHPTLSPEKARELDRLLEDGEWFTGIRDRDAKSTGTARQFHDTTRRLLLERLRRLSLQAGEPIPEMEADIPNHRIARLIGILVKSELEKARTKLPNASSRQYYLELLDTNRRLESDYHVSGPRIPLEVLSEVVVTHPEEVFRWGAIGHFSPREKREAAPLLQVAFHHMRDEAMQAPAADEYYATQFTEHNPYPWNPADPKDRAFYRKFRNRFAKLAPMFFDWDLDSAADREFVEGLAKQDPLVVVQHLEQNPLKLAQWQQSAHFAKVKRTLKTELREGNVAFTPHLESGLWNLAQDYDALVPAFEAYGFPAEPGSALVKRVETEPALAPLKKFLLEHNTRYVGLDRYFPPPMETGLGTLKELAYWKAAASEEPRRFFEYLKKPSHLAALRKGKYYGALLESLTSAKVPELLDVKWNLSDPRELRLVKAWMEQPALGLALMKKYPRPELLGALEKALQTTKLDSFDALKIRDFPFDSENAIHRRILENLGKTAPTAYAVALRASPEARKIARRGASHTMSWGQASSLWAQLYGDSETNPLPVYQWDMSSAADRELFLSSQEVQGLGHFLEGYELLKVAAPLEAANAKAAFRQRLIDATKTGWFPGYEKDLALYPWDLQDPKDIELAKARIEKAGGSIALKDWWTFLKALHPEASPEAIARAAQAALAQPVRWANLIGSLGYSQTSVRFKEGVEVPLVRALLTSESDVLQGLRRVRGLPADFKTELEALRHHPDSTTRSEAVALLAPLQRHSPTEVQWVADKVKAEGLTEETANLLSTYGALDNVTLLRAIRDAVTRENARSLYHMFSDREGFKMPDSRHSFEYELRIAIEKYTSQRIFEKRAEASPEIQGLAPVTFETTMKLLRSPDPDLKAEGLSRFLDRRLKVRGDAERSQALIELTSAIGTDLAHEATNAIVDLVRSAKDIPPEFWRRMEGHLANHPDTHGPQVLWAIGRLAHHGFDLNEVFKTHPARLLKPVTAPNVVANFLYAFASKRGMWDEAYTEWDELHKDPNAAPQKVDLLVEKIVNGKTAVEAEKSEKAAVRDAKRAHTSQVVTGGRLLRAVDKHFEEPLTLLQRLAKHPQPGAKEAVELEWLMTSSNPAVWKQAHEVLETWESNPQTRASLEKALGSTVSGLDELRHALRNHLHQQLECEGKLRALLKGRTK